MLCAELLRFRPRKFRADRRPVQERALALKVSYDQAQQGSVLKKRLVLVR